MIEISKVSQRHSKGGTKGENALGVTFLGEGKLHLKDRKKNATLRSNTKTTFSMF